MSDVNRQQEFLLLSRFNARDTEAFVSVYKLFFTELHLYASRLYNCTTVSPEDAVQDVFCSLLENKGDSLRIPAQIESFPLYQYQKPVQKLFRTPKSTGQIQNIYRNGSDLCL